MSFSATFARNQLIAKASSFPDLLAATKRDDPTLYDALKGKSLLGSKTIIGTPMVTLVTWLVSYWGLGWDFDTCTYVSGILSYVALVLFRLMTTTHIASVLPQKDPTP